LDKIVGPEARGFIFGSLLAHELGIGFIPVRKPGKLPGDVESVEYELEYGTDKIEIHKDAIEKGERILIIDDLIATSGTCLATCDLIEKLGGKIVSCAFLVELEDLGGRKKLEDKNYEVFSLIKFEESG